MRHHQSGSKSFRNPIFGKCIIPAIRTALAASAASFLVATSAIASISYTLDVSKLHPGETVALSDILHIDLGSGVDYALLAISEVHGVTVEGGGKYNFSYDPVEDRVTNGSMFTLTGSGASYGITPDIPAYSLGTITWNTGASSPSFDFEVNYYPTNSPYVYPGIASTTVQIVSRDAAPPTQLELAGMSNATYGESTSRPDIGKFTLLKSVGLPGEAGLYADFYVSKGENGGKDQIVLAIRGTTSIISDFQKYNGSFLGVGAAEAFEANAQSLAGLVGDLAAAYPGADFTFTGHSLGGAYASVLAWAANADAVTFDAPGAGQLLSDASFLQPLRNAMTGVQSATQDITAIRHYGDQVSEIGDPIGAVQTIIPDASEKLNIDILPFGTCIVVCHKMDLMYQLIQNGAEIVPGYAGPFGAIDQALQEGAIDVATGVKTFNTSVLPDGWRFFDPALNGDFIYIDMGDSDVSLAKLALPGSDIWYVIEGLVGDQWSVLASGFGDSIFSGLGGFDQYRINNAGYLADEFGNYVIAMSFDKEGTFRGSLRSGGAGAVPEPASWAMMIAGFGLVGAAMRRRKATVRFA